MGERGTGTGGTPPKDPAVVAVALRNRLHVQSMHRAARRKLAETPIEIPALKSPRPDDHAGWNRACRRLAPPICRRASGFTEAAALACCDIMRAVLGHDEQPGLERYWQPKAERDLMLYGECFRHPPCALPFLGYLAFGALPTVYPRETSA